MTISILGCGWFGRALAAQLIAKGINVKGSTTNTDKLAELQAMGIRPYLIRFPNDQQNDNAFFQCDVLVVSIPPKFRKGESDEFITKVNAMIKSIKDNKIGKLIYTSSTGVYGDEQGVVDELTTPQPGDTSGRLLLQAEQLFQDQSEFATTIIRFAGLVGPGRNPGRFFAGKKDVPNGRSPINLVHLDDAVGIAIAIIEKGIWREVINACSPDHPTRAEFYSAASQHAGLELPEFKDELGTSKTVNSLKVAEQLKYQYQHDNWSATRFS